MIPAAAVPAHPTFVQAPKSRLYYPRLMDAVATEHKLFFHLGKQD